MRTPSRRSFLVAGASLAGVALVPPGAWARPAVGPRRWADGDAVASFLAAVSTGQLDEVRARLSADASLAAAVDDAGRSALVLALVAQHVAVGEALRSAGAPVGLVEAAMLEDWERATELANADRGQLNALHPVGGSVLYAVARAGHGDFYQLQDLAADPDANPAGPRGVTPAYGALECPSASDALRSLAGLLSNGAHVNTPQRGGDSLLHAAARRGDPALVAYLLRRGADRRALDEQGRSPLALAQAHGHDAAAALLSNPASVPRDDMTTRYAFDASGAPVVWPDLSDLTAEQQGAVTGPSHFNLEGVKAALAGEPRRSFSRSTQTELAVEACGHTGNRPIMRLHLDHGVPQSLCTSLSLGHLDRARALLAGHPNAIRERGPHDFAPLWYASIGGGSVEAAELLLDAGAPVDQESLGTTALHWAARRGQLELMGHN